MKIYDQNSPNGAYYTKTMYEQIFLNKYRFKSMPILRKKEKSKLCLRYHGVSIFSI